MMGADESFNPYAPPQSGDLAGQEGSDFQDPSQPTYRLYSAGSVVWATIFGALMAGGVILAINDRRLGRAAEAGNILLGAAIATLAVLGLAFLLPENIPNVLITIPQCVGIYYLARALQGDVIAAHVRRGGRLASAWYAIGIGLLVSIAIGAIVVAAIIVFQGLS
ncbi:MAG TPA: hypothetical protein VF590_15700 [Isosphaeraceae bacterium]|jgi:hypothetical protein